MTRYRLLVDFEVVEYLTSLPRRRRARLRDCLMRIWQDPTKCSDYRELDSVGRPVEIHICADHAVKYWIDIADLQIKVLDVYSADKY